LDEALAISRPEIFNTDLGSQFSSQEYTGRLDEAGIAVSRDGRGGPWTTCSWSGCGGV
jgi:putative transposase